MYPFDIIELISIQIAQNVIDCVIFINQGMSSIKANSVILPNINPIINDMMCNGMHQVCFSQSGASVKEENVAVPFSSAKIWVLPSPALYIFCRDG